MILQALYEYYQRKSAYDADGVAPEGFEYKEIPFIMVIDKYGKFIDLQDTREPDEKRKLRAKAYLVPQGVKRAAGIKSNVLWDNSEYAFGISMRGETEDKIQERHHAFCKLLNDVFGEAPIEPIKAVLTFLADPDQKQKMQEHREWQKAVAFASNANFTFKILGDLEIIAAKAEVQEIIRKAVSTPSDSAGGICLVTGEKQEIERLHPSIKGVWGAQTSGANIISFNLDAFTSYDKKQGENAPVGKSTAFAYTTALNMLLGKDSKQRIQVGDTSTVYWAEKDTPFEDFFGDLITDPKDDPDRHVKAVEALYRSPQAGTNPITEESTKFYILGLAPNAARISVRFWHITTVAEISGNIRQHFEDLEICHAPHHSPYLSIFRLLSSIATQEKAENIPPNLAGDAMKAIITGTPYPATLLQAAIRRNRATRDVSYARAALIKACLNRFNRYYSKQEKEMTMALDPENTNIGYNLGRLFAVLEKIQEEANPGLKATIRDRYYGAASATPVSVFPILMKLKNHHLSKIGKEKKGLEINLEARVSEIVNQIEASGAFPRILTLEDQGRFAIGYYHQRQQFFTKKSANTEQKEAA